MSNKAGKYRIAIIISGAIIVVIAALWLFVLPWKLFPKQSYSTVALSREGELLGARIADDGQWRFPPCKSVPEKYSDALICFEDKRFRHHLGVDPLAVGRALVQNLRSGQTVSGASTISMQVVRLSRCKRRTLTEKALEAVLALRLEARYSKDEILALYASHAPFGGNVVGIDAAAWRYFGRPPRELSYAEAALLAILPNSPAALHPGKNRTKLLSKRNALLGKLFAQALIPERDYALALEEPLPSEPLPLPSYAAHYIEHFAPKGRQTTTTIDLSLQKKLEAITDRRCREFSTIGINDLAAVVLDTRSGEVLAWRGNSDLLRKRPGVSVDIAAKPRSTGSILKPFLYCAALEEGVILPHTLLKDTPLNIDGFTPQNFDEQYSGAVPAGEALAKSLNIPFVNLLRSYGVPRFWEKLKALGLDTFSKGADHYGLSLILGGGEGRLDQITKAYAAMGRQLYWDSSAGGFDPLAVSYTFEALSRLDRPDEIDPRLFPSALKVAWKTGTSYGFRDGWAVGVTSEYTVGVWCGNAVGEGVPGLVGGKTAGRVMLDVFNALPGRHRGPPRQSDNDEYIECELCHLSGHLKGPYCTLVDTLLLPKSALRTSACPYDGPEGFVLPPAMEWYYRKNHPEYLGAPIKKNSLPMEFVYPENGSTLTIPRQLDGSLKGIVARVAHSDPDAVIYWHLDSEYLACTKGIHQIALLPTQGRHTLTAVDNAGCSISETIFIR